MAEVMTKQEAINFFSEFYGGEHNIPTNRKNEPDVQEFGLGFACNNSRDLSTWDSNYLTLLVMLAHKYHYRVSVAAIKKGVEQIQIWKRLPRNTHPELTMSKTHPGIKELIEKLQKMVK